MINNKLLKQLNIENCINYNILLKEKGVYYIEAFFDSEQKQIIKFDIKKSRVINRYVYNNNVLFSVDKKNNLIYSCELKNNLLYIKRLESDFKFISNKSFIEEELNTFSIYDNYGYIKTYVYNDCGSDNVYTYIVNINGTYVFNLNDVIINNSYSDVNLINNDNNIEFIIEDAVFNPSEISYLADNFDKRNNILISNFEKSKNINNNIQWIYLDKPTNNEYLELLYLDTNFFISNHVDFNNSTSNIFKKDFYGEIKFNYCFQQKIDYYLKSEYENKEYYISNNNIIFNAYGDEIINIDINKINNMSEGDFIEKSSIIIKDIYLDEIVILEGILLLNDKYKKVKILYFLGEKRFTILDSTFIILDNVLI